LIPIARRYTGDDRTPLLDDVVKPIASLRTEIFLFMLGVRL
jgi:hypothetical protein